MMYLLVERWRIAICRPSPSLQLGCASPAGLPNGPQIAIGVAIVEFTSIHTRDELGVDNLGFLQHGITQHIGHALKLGSYGAQLDRTAGFRSETSIFERSPQL